MKYALIALSLFLVLSCREKVTENLSAQDIVNRSIEEAGGEAYLNSNVQFQFRDRYYVLEIIGNSRLLKRISLLDTAVVVDIKEGQNFRRLINDQPVALPDSTANRYANSVNSVHYFAYLPYGLNDPAVNKELLGNSTIKGESYYKVRVTFEREGGGDDFDDVYVYWFNQDTFKPDYLAYEFHVDGGGLRFRKAYNERYINGLRFVDYENYKYGREVAPELLDSLYQQGRLELLSKIELKNVEVSRGSGN